MFIQTVFLKNNFFLYNKDIKFLIIKLSLLNIELSKLIFP